ncbi:MAG: MFS transporter [Phycisphaeraceae bacterium]|nr:MFS transporter [Phycisphaeraceae bacterium]
MNSASRRLLLVATFLGSIAVIFLERGLYFFTDDQLGFSRFANLWLGLSHGVAYAIGALLSHAAAGRFGERRTLLWLTTVLTGLMVLLTWRPIPGVVWIVFPVSGVFNGCMWPIIESYTTAGLVSKQMFKVVGRFCIAWSSAVPIALAISGPLIASPWPASLFAVAMLLFAVMIVMFARLPARPMHAPPDHPELPDPSRRQRYRALMIAGRWSMLSNYALLFLLAPMLPYILTTRLDLSTQIATPIASLMDWTRVLAFISLGAMTAWYGRASPLLAAVALMPAGFLMVLFGPSLQWVIAGELLFGLVGGLVYYAALYYALAFKNAAVEAGGGHEALIGAGFALGPACGLIGLSLAGAMGDEVYGMLAGVVPLVLLCMCGGAIPLHGLRRRDKFNV